MPLPSPGRVWVINYKLVKSFTFPEVLPLCVALLALPRKAGVAILIGFARLGGYSAGIVANQPAYLAAGA